MMEFLAYCGLYCGACGYRNAALTKNRDHIANVSNKTPEEIERIIDGPPCPGCKQEENICGTCKLRDCAVVKGVATCVECGEFPCAALQSFNDDGVPHHGQCIANLQEILALGDAAWLQKQTEKWNCDCGQALSWYMAECPECGKANPSGLELARKL